MKTKFSKILGVGLTIALLTSLLLTAAPVSALGVPAVSFPATTDDDISKVDAGYTITFILGKDLEIADTITLTFPSGYTIASGITATLSASPGWVAGSWITPATATATFAGDATAKTITGTVATAAIGEGATVRIAITAGITNPITVGSYTLTVKTTDEATEVASAAYSIGAPTISALPGIVSVYNEADVLMTQKSGDTAIADAIAAATGVSKPVIKLGPGTYTEYPNTATASTIFIATGTAAETIIKGSWTIDVASVTLENLTLQQTAASTTTPVITIATTGDKATIKNCVITKASSATGAQLMVVYGNTVTDGTGTISGCTFDTTSGTVVDTGIDINQLGLTVSGCSFTLDSGDTAIDIGANATVKDCPSITGTAGIGVLATTGTATVSGSTFDGLQNAFVINGGTITVSGNTIKNCTGSTTTSKEGAITINGGVAKISSNDINTTTSTKYAIYLDDAVTATTTFVLFNNIDNTLNIKNETASSDKLNATHNWWGVATGPASTSISGDVNTANYLSSAVTAAKASFTTTAASLTAKTTAGVDVSITDSSGATSATVTLIGASSYTANPGTATPYTALAGGFYDVYVTDTATTDIVTILLYNAGVTANTEVYVMNALTGTWTKCAPLLATDPATQGVNAVSGYAYVTVKGITTVPAITDLTGTVFGLVNKPAAAAVFAAPTILAPTLGEKDVSIQPTFAWGAVTGAAGYYFELADNANFVLPLIKLDGDLGRLMVTYYQHVPKLDYSSPYYWRVEAVKGTVEGKNLVTSAWTSGVFITKDEPVEPTPPVVIEPTPPAPIIKPIVEVITPPATPITPAWIYVIIGVGAVLVIAVIVLIVRTRRVA